VGGGLKVSPSPYENLFGTIFGKKIAFLKKRFTFLTEKYIFSENFWDLWGFSQICIKI
jgi:hypothetical protein